MKFRKKDTMGEVQVPADKYWGQTERSRNNFKIPSASMPNEIIGGFAYLKKRQHTLIVI
jgi:fumarate hydratase class II